jgi:hypothetical protein
MSTGYQNVIKDLSKQQRVQLAAVKQHAESILNHTPRFKFFTLHGTNHLDNLFEILDIFRKGGIKLQQEDVFLLSLAICIHDLGMVASLADKEDIMILEGRKMPTDQAALEEFIRNAHHELVDAYYQDNLNFLTDIGLSPAQLAQVRNISRCHRKVVLHEQRGVVQYLGALLRVIDELDLGANRAPANVFQTIAPEMDSTACWHWFKHNIVEGWTLQNTVHYKVQNGRQSIEFVLVVHPSRENSIQYWLTQIRRPIFKALQDDGAAEIIKARFNVDVIIHTAPQMCSKNSIGAWFHEMEDRALSSGRKVVLVADDEFRKLEDLFLPLQDRYHIEQAHHARDAFMKLQAREVDLIIVDLQIGSGGLWTAQETEDFKFTGLRLCEEINKRHPNTKVGILTGTKHRLPNELGLQLQFLLRKPVDPDFLHNKVNECLAN